MLALEDVALRRGGRDLLQGLAATFAPGTFVGILGANGIGKSTLLGTICGLIAPARGTIRFDGRDIAALAPRERARRLALVEPAEAVLGSITVGDAVAGGRYPYHRWWEWAASPADEAAIAEALAATSTDVLRDREIGTLSAGERQRVWVALALAQRAPVIALDEPTTHLDLRHAVETLRLLQQLARDGAIVLAVLHALEEAAAFADRLLLLGDGGVIADGTADAVLTAPRLERAFGVRIAVERGADGALAFHREREQ